MPAFNNVHGATGAVTELFEVWLIDTGKFIVLRDVLPSLRQCSSQTAPAVGWG